MKIASVAMCPVLGGKLRHVDDTAARKLSGVVGRANPVSLGSVTLLSFRLPCWGVGPVG